LRHLPCPSCFFARVRGTPLTRPNSPNVSTFGTQKGPPSHIKTPPLQSAEFLSRPRLSFEDFSNPLAIASETLFLSSTVSLLVYPPLQIETGTFCRSFQASLERGPAPSPPPRFILSGCASLKLTPLPFRQDKLPFRVLFFG